MPTDGLGVVVRDHEPDAIEITKATYRNDIDRLIVHAESDFAPGAFMTISVDDFILEAPSTFHAAKGRRNCSRTVSNSEPQRSRRSFM